MAEYLSNSEEGSAEEDEMEEEGIEEEVIVRFPYGCKVECFR
jgi:hypothetical protein